MVTWRQVANPDRKVSLSGPELGTVVVKLVFDWWVGVGDNFTVESDHNQVCPHQ